MSRCWYYTGYEQYLRLEQRGIISPTLYHCGFAMLRPLVWLSTCNTWEPIHTPREKRLARLAALDDDRHHLRHETTEQLPLVRIEVDDSCEQLTWEEMKSAGGIDFHSAIMLASLAAGVEAIPSQWRLSFKPIRFEQWVKVEISHDGWNWKDQVASAPVTFPLSAENLQFLPHQ